MKKLLLIIILSLFFTNCRKEEPVQLSEFIIGDWVSNNVSTSPAYTQFNEDDYMLVINDPGKLPFSFEGNYIVNGNQLIIENPGIFVQDTFDVILQNDTMIWISLKPLIWVKTQ